MATLRAGRLEDRFELQRIVDRAAAIIRRHARDLALGATIVAAFIGLCRWGLHLALANYPTPGPFILQRLLISEVFSVLEAMFAAFFTAWIAVILVADGGGVETPSPL